MLGDFDGDFILESNQEVSWLIWLHLLVMFLIFVLLYYFTIFVSDVTSEVGQSQIMAKKHNSSSSCSSQDHFKVCRGGYTTPIKGEGTISIRAREIITFIGGAGTRTSDLLVSQGQTVSISRGNTSTNTREGKGNGRQLLAEEGIIQEVKDYSSNGNEEVGIDETRRRPYASSSNNFPLNLIELAKTAILKCLGLDSTTSHHDSSSKIQQEKSKKDKSQ